MQVPCILYSCGFTLDSGFTEAEEARGHKSFAMAQPCMLTVLLNVNTSSPWKPQGCRSRVLSRRPPLRRGSSHFLRFAGPGSSSGGSEYFDVPCRVQRGENGNAERNSVRVASVGEVVTKRDPTTNVNPGALANYVRRAASLHPSSLMALANTSGLTDLSMRDVLARSFCPALGDTASKIAGSGALGADFPVALHTAIHCNGRIHVANCNVRRDDAHFAPIQQRQVPISANPISYRKP
ncbi:hypothetical protein ON010_g16907 [Phytophthora cinnamomi]|nr:hypothetical protein ON010_g16907 [Phytophthora cinnamomi]